MCVCVCVCVCVCERREVCDSDLPRLCQKLRYEVGGRGCLSHAYSGVGGGGPQGAHDFVGRRSGSSQNVFAFPG